MPRCIYISSYWNGRPGFFWKHILGQNTDRDIWDQQKNQGTFCRVLKKIKFESKTGERYKDWSDSNEEEISQKRKTASSGFIQWREFHKSWYWALEARSEKAQCPRTAPAGRAAVLGPFTWPSSWLQAAHRLLVPTALILCHFSDVWVINSILCALNPA